MEITGYVDAYQGDKELKVISSRILDEEPKVIAPEKMSAKDAMDYEKSGGKLVQVEGTVTDVLYDAAGTGVSQFWLDDGSGVNCQYFSSTDISLSATTGKNELASVVSAGKTRVGGRRGLCTSGGNLGRGSDLSACKKLRRDRGSDVRRVTG